MRWCFLYHRSLFHQRDRADLLLDGAARPQRHYQSGAAWIGLIDVPIPLLYNKLGILIGMTYVLLPYMILTLYAAMRGIDPSLTRAALGLGASRIYTFWRIYFPLSLHGVISGSLIVFILAIGFFLTPALMGGPATL